MYTKYTVLPISIKNRKLNKNAPVSSLASKYAIHADRNLSLADKRDTADKEMSTNNY